MESNWLRELRSPPTEGPFRGAARQLGAGCKLVVRDRAILLSTLIGGLAQAAIWIAVLSLDRHDGTLTREGDWIFRQLLVSAASLAVLLSTSLSIACAADARIDGAAGGLRLVFDEVRERLPALLGWWAISMVGWIGLGFAAHALLSGPLALLAVNLVWGVGTMFVVAALAIDGGGPLSALRTCLRLLRRSWGRALVALLLLICFYLFVLIPIVIALPGRADQSLDRHGAGLWVFYGGIVLYYVVAMVMIAAREGFAVIRARDVLGDLPGEPRPPRARRTVRVVLGRVVIGAVGLLVLLFVLGTIFGLRNHSGSSSTAAARPVAKYSERLPGPQAMRIEPGAPVCMGVTRIGTVYDTTAVSVAGEPPTMLVDFEVESKWVDSVRSLQLVADESDGSAYLRFRAPPRRPR